MLYKSKNKNLIPLLLLLSVFLTGCAGSVKLDQLSNYKYNGEKYSGVDVTLSQKAQKDYENNDEFDKNAIQQKIFNHLNTKNLINQSSKNKLHVEITDISIRSNFAAVMFGFMAGSDSIDGKVTLTDQSNNNRGSFTVSASYALGGTGGGQDETRMRWLYDKFAELTADTILQN